MRRLATVIVLVLATSSCSDDPAPTSGSGGAEPQRATVVTTDRPVVATLPEATTPPTSADDTSAGAPPAQAVAGDQVPLLTDLVFRLEATGTIPGLPTDLIGRPGDAALYVAQKEGLVHRLLDGESTVLLDLTDQVSSNSERGVLGIAFTPDSSEFIVSYTDREGSSVLSAWPVVDPDAPVPELGGERTLLVVPQPFANHNGGDVEFGPDGYLYWALGDGGSGGDPLDSGQDTSTLLGAILRLELTDNGATAAPGNPLTPPERPELWLWGLRNPWRFSFDPASGDMWIGDVGQSALEEINRVPAAPSSRNLGWNRLEGSQRFQGSPPADHLAPIVEYGRATGTSVTGGFVYRGQEQPWLDGVYVYADFGAGWVRGLRQMDGTVTEHAELLDDVGNVTAFGRDAEGEIYVMEAGGRISRLIAEPAS